MTKTYDDEMKKVRGARVKLLAKHPFFGDLAFSSPIVIDDTLNPPTAAVDGKRLIFHPDLVNKLPTDELVFVLAHEVVHLMLLHIIRRQNRHPGKWNVACDIVDNYMLIQHGVGKAPDWIVHMPDLYIKGKGKVELIYDLLPNNVEYGTPGSGGKFASFDAIRDADPAEAEEIAAKWRSAVAKAADLARQAGQMSGSLEAFVDQITTPKVAWQDRFHANMTANRRSDKTYTKINRRYANLSTRLPGNVSEMMGPIVFAVDCSGSTDDKMISQTGAEINTVAAELCPEKIHVLYFDTEVKRHEEFDPGEEITVKAYGRGGTCFRRIFEYIEAAGIEPEHVVVATDLECHDFGPEPPYPVLWCVLQGRRSDAPWGEVLVVD